MTESEKWPVGVTAHHVAGGHEPISGIVKTVAGGQSILNHHGHAHESNAKHAREFAGCTKAETLALHGRARRRGRGRAGLSDADLSGAGPS